MTKKTLLFLILGLLILPIQATAIEQETITFTLVQGKTVVDYHILLEEKRVFILHLPQDAQTISLRLEGKDIEQFPLTENTIHVNARDISLSFVSAQFFQQNTFLTDIPASEAIQKLTVSLLGEENQILRSPLDPSTLASNAVFPKPTRVSTDGQRLVLTWERNNLPKGESLSILVRFKEKPRILLFVLLGMLLLLVLGIILFLYLRKHPRIVTKIERVEVPVIREVEKVVEKPVDHVEHHLKEDEEQVVTLLKQREGQCEQGTLRVLTGFSKAKLSALLQELEARKVIIKEKRGKKNLVFLKK